MLKSSFNYQLPDELIARYPAKERASSRLLVLPAKGDIEHSVFNQCINFLRPGDLLVFNNTKVVPARLFGRKETGGAVEILVERLLPSEQLENLEAGRIVAQIKASKAPKPGSCLYLDDETELTVIGRDGMFFVVSAQKPWFEIMETHGHMPLPPYIDREDEIEDRDRYQTVYATKPGAVAAPTAGLHFDEALLAQIDKIGVKRAEVTLHVGAGTYQPVRADQIEDHDMHAEWIRISEQTCGAIREAKSRGNRVIAVGTTALRTLESVAQFSSDDSFPSQAYSGDTSIFIYPGYQFRCVDALVTNFHLPESTLLMLVSAFAGYQRIKSAYQEAIDQQYRFFSYGDAMFLEKNIRAIEDIPQ